MHKAYREPALELSLTGSAALVESAIILPVVQAAEVQNKNGYKREWQWN